MSTPNPIEAHIDNLLAQPNLAPETVRLLELAKEANATGKMPEIPKAEEEDPYQSDDYQRFAAKVAETCDAHDAPCDSCLAGGICDGPNTTRFDQEEDE